MVSRATRERRANKVRARICYPGCGAAQLHYDIVGGSVEWQQWVKINGAKQARY